jgi:mono/diheme cytochrome c family protein
MAGAQKATPPKTAKAATAGDPAAGKALFQKHCNLCHYADKTTNKIGPGLKGVFTAKELPKSHRPVSDASVREQIEKGNAAKGMPAFGAKLSKAEIDNLIAYLKSL